MTTKCCSQAASKMLESAKDVRSAGPSRTSEAVSKVGPGQDYDDSLVFRAALGGGAFCTISQFKIVRGSSFAVESTRRANIVTPSRLHIGHQGQGTSSNTKATK